MSFHIREIPNPTEPEIQQMVDALDASFDFKYWDHSLPTNRVRSVGMLRSHITAAMADPGGEIWVAEDAATKEIVGVATWHGPGSAFLSTEAQRVDWDPMFATLDQPSKDFWDNFFPIYDAYTAEAFGDGVKLGGYHLQALGVTPTHWRRGIGRALMKIGEEKAKAAKVCTCIETVGHTAITFYARCGYEVKKPKLYCRVGDPDNANVPLYGLIKHFD